MDRIRNGVYPPGSQLPPEVELAQEEGVNRHTLRRALGNLEMMGHINRSHGGGTFVAPQRAIVNIALDRYESLHPHLTERQGYTSELRDLTISSVVGSDDIAGRLDLVPGSSVTRVSFVVDVDGIPMACFDLFSPAGIVSVEKMREGFDESAIDFFDGCDGRPRLDSYRMEVREVRAEPPLADQLDVTSGRTLFLFDGEMFDDNDNMIGISMGYFVPECVRITVERRAVVHEHTDPCP